ncbi:uncharacterized protein F5891DRAFT_302267 [Suillus fuscotomentosus]|uniref:Uncharacterized protein n=1 Tax=Suillus fuscotomentosus TaxID=1912939 RepID=A0AAD4HLA6_9AGAM|nr:uncharacterized protein F5891DRAFT_302267 [Suillus fuscotomentosus]KAG1900642.1 hypothetical protein F5891DRAFT_302267 [Suillus fuscotomentosus]
MVHTNPVDDEELDNDPGAYVLGFGKHAGERLDSIPTHYRLWATGAECQHFHWYADLKEANDRYEEQLLQTPEAYTLSFGKHQNKRLDEVPEDYIWSVIRPSFSNNPWYQSLVEAHRRYLDQVYQNKSPGSVDIWFGQQCRGYPLSSAYKRRGFIEFCLRPEHNNFKWYYKFKDLVRRYEAHLASHRRPYRRRKPANVENPVGELLGHWDDHGSVEPGDEYERDDFVVDDGEGEDEDSQEDSGSQSDDSNDDHGFDDFQGEEIYDDSEVNTTGDPDGSSPEQPSCASAAVSQASESESDSDSDDNTPLDELPHKIRAKRVSGKKKAEVVSSPSNDDIAAQPPQKRRKGTDHFMSCSCMITSVTMAGLRLVRDRPARNEFNSVAEPVASMSHLDEQELSHSGSFQESAASSSTADESQVEDESSQSDNKELSDDYIPPPSLLGGYYRSLPRVIPGFYHQKMS